MPSTILRVKRRRDEPSPPNTIQLQSIHSHGNSVHPSLGTSQSRLSSKRAREEDSETKELVQLMNRSHLDKISASSFSASTSSQNNTQREKAIVFRKVNHLDAVSNASSLNSNQRHKRKLDTSSKFLSSSFSRKSNGVESSLSNESEYYNHDNGDSDDDKLHVVEATLEMNELPEQEQLNDDARHRNKRCKMSIQMVDKRTISSSDFWKLHEDDTKVSKEDTGTESQNTQQKKKLNSTPILNPHASIVNSSLLKLHSSSIPDFQSHLKLFIERDLPDKYINWQCTDGSGTIGHIIALHNDIDAFKSLLDFDLKYLASRNSGESVLNLFQKDKEGRCIYDVAKLVGANGIVQILESRGWDCNDNFDLSPSTNDSHVIKKNENDDEDFVYDVYALHHDGDNDLSSSTHTSLAPKTTEIDSSSDAQATLNILPNDMVLAQSDVNVSTKSGGFDSLNYFVASPEKRYSDQDDNSLPIIMNVRGGVGYWGENGQLILDVYPSDHDSDYLEEDEYDSNKECCDANDYPDEESSEDDYGNFDGKNVVDSGYFDSYLGDPTQPRFGNHLGYAIDNNYIIDSDSDGLDTNEFRYRAASFGHKRESRDIRYQDDSDSEHEYRGFMRGESSSWSNERIIDETTDAFDEDLDIDSS